MKVARSTLSPASLAIASASFWKGFLPGPVSVAAARRQCDGCSPRARITVATLAPEMNPSLSSSKTLNASLMRTSSSFCLAPLFFFAALRDWPSETAGRRESARQYIASNLLVPRIRSPFLSRYLHSAGQTTAPAATAALMKISIVASSIAVLVADWSR